MRVYRTVVRTDCGQDSPMGFELERVREGRAFWVWYYLLPDLDQQMARARELAETFYYTEVQMGDTPRLTGDLLVQLMNGGNPLMQWSVHWKPERCAVS